MARPVTYHVFERFPVPAIPLGLGLFVWVILLVALCAKHARQVPGKRSPEPNMPKQLITSIGHKAIMHLLPAARKPDAEERGLWQKGILMGEKCRPPQFPGVIYYDCSGNRTPEMPMSPRAIHLSPLRTSVSSSLDSKDNSPPLTVVNSR